MGGKSVGLAFELGCESKNVRASQGAKHVPSSGQKLFKNRGPGFAASFLSVFLLCSQLRACAFLLPLITSFQLCLLGCLTQSGGPQTFPIPFAGPKR